MAVPWPRRTAILRPLIALHSLRHENSPLHNTVPVGLSAFRPGVPSPRSTQTCFVERRRRGGNGPALTSRFIRSLSSASRRRNRGRQRGSIRPRAPGGASRCCPCPTNDKPRPLQSPGRLLTLDSYRIVHAARHRKSVAQFPPILATTTHFNSGSIGAVLPRRGVIEGQKSRCGV